MKEKIMQILDDHIIAVGEINCIDPEQHEQIAEKILKLFEQA
jgi:S-methylmethionine-dependent homocysteine/selenocysteine methylase